MESWDPQKMLDLYILDYMKRNNMHETAEIFANEAGVPPNPAVLSSPEGFLTEWWSVFWEVYSSRLPSHQEAGEESSVKASQMMGDELQNVFPMMTSPGMNQQRAGQIPNELQNIFPMMTSPGLNQQRAGQIPNELQNVFPMMTSPGMNQQRAGQIPI
ncbi:unnamed protein product, partial [Ilex paraguariensis]